jgi:hypothetical protein
MTRSIVFAAVAAAAMALAVPAQATIADPGLNSAAPSNIHLAYYYHHHYYRHRPYGWHSYAYVPHRHWHCWSGRVWSWGHWRWVRHCGW